ncbi:MAG: transcription elongation factor GreA [Dehalococcoidia bacterium]
MPQQPTYLTEEGLEKLTAELEHLCNVRRPEVAARIQRAKELESTANNAEYDDAKNEQAFVEGRILTLDTVIKNATVVHQDHPSTRVRIGSTVRVTEPDGAEQTYTIVGSTEADASHGRISNESPVGKALLGRRVGDQVKVSTPGGSTRLKLVELR